MRMTTKTSNLRAIITEMTSGVAKKAALSCFIPLQPVPASRPRVPRFGKPYYAGRYKEWINAAKKLIKASDTTLEGALLVSVRQRIKPAKTTKLKSPTGDVDNFAKAPLDRLNNADGYWVDDKQIQVLLVNKRFTLPGEAEGTMIDIFEYENNKRR